MISRPFDFHFTVRASLAAVALALQLLFVYRGLVTRWILEGNRG